MSKKMCKLYSIAEKDTKAYTKYVLPAKYVCKKCGRVANSDDLLCRPKELELKKSKDQKDNEKKEKKEQKKKKDKEKSGKKSKKGKIAVSKVSIAPPTPQNPPEPVDAEAINKYIVKTALSNASIEKKRVKVSKSQVLK